MLKLIRKSQIRADRYTNQIATNISIQIQPNAEKVIHKNFFRISSLFYVILSIFVFKYGRIHRVFVYLNDLFYYSEKRSITSDWNTKVLLLVQDESNSEVDLVLLLYDLCMARQNLSGSTKTDKWRKFKPFFKAKFTEYNCRKSR